MPKLTLRHWLLYVLPLATVVVGPFVLAGASSYLEHREDLRRARNIQKMETFPEAVAEDAEHDFGTMDALTEGTHCFVIQNRGQGPLELRLLEPSSTRLRATLSSSTVAPGQAAEIRVTWKTPPSSAEFAEGVMVETNDPGNHEQIPLTIRGKVRVQVGAEPTKVVIGEVEPDAAGTASILVYSQLWPDLAVLNAACSIAGASCSWKPAESRSLEAVQAKSGGAVTVALPRDMPAGPFRGVVRISAQRSSDSSRAHSDLAVPISGRVLRRLAVHGDGVQENGVVDMGIHPPGVAWQHRLLLRVRDLEQELRLTDVDIKPDFLKVSLAPCRTESGAGLYTLDISVPADAPRCIYRGVQLGELKLTFDHPRIRELELRLGLAVMPKR